MKTEIGLLIFGVSCALAAIAAESLLLVLVAIAVIVAALVLQDGRRAR